MPNSLFSCVGLLMVMMFLQESFAGNRKLSGNAGVGAKQTMNTYLKDTLKKLDPTKLGGGLSAHVHRLTWRAARVVTDFFVACMRVTDFYTCCSFCGKNHGDGFLRPLFLATDFFVAREHASHVHLGAFVSQNHSGTDHWVRLAVQADASCQDSDTCNTIDNHNAGVSPSASLTTSWRCNLQPRVCVVLQC